MARTPAPGPGPAPGPQNVTLQPGDSIQGAIDANPAGSTFNFSAGVWREQEFLSQANNKFIGDPGGGTILSGARVVDQWRPDGNLWRSNALPEHLGDNKPATNPLANHLNELFVDDVLLTRVGSRNEVNEGSWCYDNGCALTGTDPNGKLMEYSVTRNQTWNQENRATGCTWENITVEKYCSDAQQGAHHGMSGWHYKNATFRQMHGSGNNIGENTVVENCRFIGNGHVGIGGYQSHNCRIENTEMAHNGWVGYNTDWDAGGMKICSSSNVIVRANHVHHNKDQGIWADIDCTDWLIEDNTSEHNEGVGIMYEISYGETTIRNNHCADNGGTGGYGAGGIYISNSRGVDVSGNTITVKHGNSGIGGGISIINDERGSGNQGVYEARAVNVHHNQITHENDTAMDGYWVYKDISEPGIAFDNNTYHVKDPNAQRWRYIDQDVTWQELQARGQEPNGQLMGLDEGGGQPPGGGGEQPPDPGNGGGGGEEIPTLAPGTYRVSQGTTLIV